jgi:hypothetical protein
VIDFREVGRNNLVYRSEPKTLYTLEKQIPDTFAAVPVDFTKNFESSSLQKCVQISRAYVEI